MSPFRLNLTKRFTAWIVVLLMGMALSSQVFFSQQARRSLELRLAEKARFLNGTYALFLADALARKDDIALQQLINFLEQDQEIASVIVVDQHDQIRYHANPEKVGTTLDDPLVKQVLQNGDGIVTTLQNDGGKVLALIAPLKRAGIAQPIGVTRIELTYRWVDKQIGTFRTNYWLFVVPGSILFISGTLLVFLQRQVLQPLQGLRQALGNVHPTMPETRFPEGPDEWGQLHAAVNELLLRFRTEWQRTQTDTAQRGEQEIQWANQLVRSFLPGARLIMADKDNRIVLDSGNGAHPSAGENLHLMDLITDSNFATLLNVAFQKEGEAAHGSVNFQEKTYEAAVLSLPSNQSVLVKTLVALRAN